MYILMDYKGKNHALHFANHENYLQRCEVIFGTSGIDRMFFEEFEDQEIRRSSKASQDKYSVAQGPFDLLNTATVKDVSSELIRFC